MTVFFSPSSLSPVTVPFSAQVFISVIRFPLPKIDYLFSFFFAAEDF